MGRREENRLTTNLVVFQLLMKWSEFNDGAAVSLGISDYHWCSKGAVSASLWEALQCLLYMQEGLCNSNLLL